MKWSEIFQMFKKAEKNLRMFYSGISMTGNGYKHDFNDIAEQIGAERKCVDKNQYVFAERHDINGNRICSDIFQLKYDDKSIVFIPPGTAWSDSREPAGRLACVANRLFDAGAGGVLFYDLGYDFETRWSIDIDVILPVLAKRLRQYMIYPIEESGMKHIFVRLRI